MKMAGNSGHCGIGGAEGDRTLDLCIANAALSQLSYRPKWATFYTILSGPKVEFFSPDSATISIGSHNRWNCSLDSCGSRYAQTYPSGDIGLSGFRLPIASIPAGQLVNGL